MSMTAEERAKALVVLLKSDFGQSGDDVWFYAIRDELKAHAHAALEAAAVEADGRTLSSEKCRTDGGCSHIQCLVAREIATAIRALREEG